MYLDQFTKTLRKLAKSQYWQTIYSQAKEIRLKIFKNNVNYTYLQVMFLSYLNFYNSLFLDIALDEVDEIVLRNEIFEDAYMYYKNKSKNKYKINKDKKENSVPTISTIWDFKTKKKR